MDQIIAASDQKPRKLGTSGKLLIAATGGVGITLSVVCASFVAPAFRKICLPFVPATQQQIANVFSLLPKKSGRLLDIGSGDGRIVIAAAKKGWERADGVELNPWLVLYSRLAALRHGVHNYTQFFRKDLWKFNIKPYDTIIIFGVEQMMKDLEHKLITEAPNAKVVACRFQLPNLEPLKTIEDGVDSVWFYDLSRITRKASGK